MRGNAIEGVSREVEKLGAVAAELEARAKHSCPPAPFAPRPFVEGIGNDVGPGTRGFHRLAVFGSWSAINWRVRFSSQGRS